MQVNGWIAKFNSYPKKIKGTPKAGLCEYFKAGNTAEDYQKLIDSAKKPEDFYFGMGQAFWRYPRTKIVSIKYGSFTASRWVFDEVEQDILVANIKTVCNKVSAKTLAKELKKQKAIDCRVSSKKQEADFCKSNQQEKTGKRQ
jgi:hypothetical protein